MATMITSYSLMQFLFAPVWGRISDKVGRRPIILISLVGTAVSHVWFAMATEVWMLYASRILTGFFAATISSATAYISDITDESNRAKGMGIVGAAFGLGFILGPAVGGILSHFGGFKLPLLAAAGLSLASFVFAWFKLIESRDTSTPSETDYSRYKLTNVFMVLKHKRLGLLFTVFFIVALSFSNLETIFALYTERIFEFTMLETGYIFAFIGVCSALMQGVFIGKLTPRFGEKKLISAATLLLALTFFLLPLFNNLIYFIIITGVIALSLGMHNPSVLSLVSKNADADSRGGVLGINHSFSALGRVLGPLWAGFFFDEVGPGFPFTSASVLLFLAFMLSFGLHKNKELKGVKTHSF